MARKSRSKQRSKGAGTRSSKAKSSGKSQGGSRSGGKSSSSGGGKSGGSKSGGSKSKSKSTSSRGRSGAGTGGGQKSNPTKKSPAPKKVTVKAPAPKPKVSAPAPKAKAPAPKPKPTPAPKKTLTPVQQRFKEREAKGLDGLTGMRKVTDAERKEGKTQLTQYRAAQRESVVNNALGRQATFKTGIPSGDNLKAGSFGISEEGKAQAAANLATRTAPEGAFGISEAGRKQAAAQLQEKRAADKELKRIQARDPGLAAYISSLPPNVRNDALIGGQTRAAGVELGIGAGTIFGAKALLAPAFKTATPGLGFKGTQVGFTGMGKTGFDAIRGGGKYIASNKPQILGKGAYSSPSKFKVPGTSKLGATRYAGGTGSLGGTQTPGGVISSIVPGRASRIGFIESQAKVSPGMFDKGVQLANKLSAGNYGRSSLANTLRSQMVSGVAPGGGFGSNLGNIAGGTGVATAVAGGLNIGSSGGVDSGEPSSDGGGVSRAINFVKNNPLAIAKDFGTLNNQLNTGELTVKDIAQGVGDYRTVMAGKDFRERVENFADLPNERKEKYLTKGLELADKSAIVQNLGERAGLPADFKAQTKELGGEIERRLSTVKAGDRDSTYKAISDFARDIGTDPKLGLAGRMAESFRTRKGTTMEKIAAGYDKNTPTVKGLSAAERGIVGSVGNRILSGKATDMAREAMSGMTPGSSLTRGNVANIASNIIKDTAPGADTVSAKRASQIKSLVTGGRTGRDVTPGSLIRGVNPFRGSNRGGGITPIRSGAPAFTPSGGGGGTPVGQVPQIPPTTQFQVPEIPQQQGLDAGNLANIQKESYQNTFKNLMAINPNYSARFQMRRRRRGGRRSFAKAFSRRFFS